MRVLDYRDTKVGKSYILHELSDSDYHSRMVFEGRVFTRKEGVFNNIPYPFFKGKEDGSIRFFVTVNGYPRFREIKNPNDKG